MEREVNLVNIYWIGWEIEGWKESRGSERRGPLGVKPGWPGGNGKRFRYSYDQVEGKVKKASAPCPKEA